MPVDEPEQESDRQKLVEKEGLARPTVGALERGAAEQEGYPERRLGSSHDASSSVGFDRVVPTASVLQCVPAEPDTRLAQSNAVEQRLD